MNTETSVGIKPELDSRLGIPWFSLKVYNVSSFTYRSDVRPLTADEVDQAGRALVSPRSLVAEFTRNLHEINRRILASSDTVGIVLDGRQDGYAQGYIGDMLEATRLVRAIRAEGKKVKILTPHGDLFQGTQDPDVEVVIIPGEVEASPVYPWNSQLLRFINSQVGETPCLFPLNAHMPVLIKIDSNGEIMNTEGADLVKRAVRPDAQRGHIMPKIWSKKGVHQLQALQTTAALTGFDNALNWTEFPEAYLYPTSDDRFIAQEVIGKYGCFGHYSGNADCPPIYLHPGVATNGYKMETKFYPEARWSEVINGLAGVPTVARSITFIEPSDTAQGEMTLRLAMQALDLGLQVSKVPMSQVKLNYDWTLGSFIAFLQELSEHHGIILGCDSMPAGHAGPAVGTPSVVLGSLCYDQGFYGPTKGLVVMPRVGAYTKDVDPYDVVTAMQSMCLDRSLRAS